MGSTDSFDFSRLRAFGLKTQTSRGEWLALAQYFQVIHIERAIAEPVIIWKDRWFALVVVSRRARSKGSGI